MLWKFSTNINQLDTNVHTKRDICSNDTVFRCYLDDFERVLVNLPISSQQSTSWCRPLQCTPQGSTKIKQSIDLKWGKASIHMRQNNVERRINKIFFITTESIRTIRNMRTKLSRNSPNNSLWKLSLLSRLFFHFRRVLHKYKILFFFKSFFSFLMFPAGIMYVVKAWQAWKFG